MNLFPHVSMILVAACLASTAASKPGVQGDGLAEASAAVERGATEVAANQLEAARETLRGAVSRLDELPDSDDVATLLGSIFDNARSAGDLRLAYDAIRRQVAWYERTRAHDDEELVFGRINLSISMADFGDLAGARAVQEEMLEILQSRLADEDRYLLWARQRLVRTLFQLGDYDAASALHAKILEVRERTEPADSLELAGARGDLGAILYLRGDLDGAGEAFEKALDVYSRSLPEGHRDIIWAQGNLAAVISDRGDTRRAMTLYARNLAVLERRLPEGHPNLTSERSNLALMLGRLGDHAGARALQEKVLETCAGRLPDDHPALASARLNLAITLERIEDYEGARALTEKVLEVRRRTLPEDHPAVADAKQGIATILVNSGDADAARPLFEQVLEVREKALPADHPDLVMARSNLVVALNSLGEFERALGLSLQVLASRERTLPPDHPGLFCSRHLVAETAAALDDRETFARLAREFVDGIQRAFLANARIHAPREMEAMVAKQSDHISRALSYVRRLPELEPSAFRLVETARGAGLVPAAILAHGAQDATLQGLRDEAAAASEEITRHARGGAGRDALGAAIRRRDGAQRALLEAIAERDDVASVLAEPSVAALSATLAKDQALIGYWRTKQVEGNRGEVLLAHVVRPGEELTRIELGRLVDIDRAVSDWRDALMVPVERGAAPRLIEDSGEPLRDQGEVLRRLIFDPLLPALGDARHLTIALDDVLHAVPLDALPWEGDLLGAVFQIEVRLSLRERLWKKTALGGSMSLLALGGASFNRDPAPFDPNETGVWQEVARGVDHGATADDPLATLRGGDWERSFSPLTATRAEARGVAALFDEAFEIDAALVLDRRKASRAALEHLAPQARFIHIATHGWFAPESVPSWADSAPLDAGAGLATRLTSEEQVLGISPMVLCGVALSGANRPPDSLGREPGLVTAEEIASWELRDCELAVLSACNTNVGVRRSGQGVASLQKALQMAGARAVITSLWKVPDEATKELMLDFYRRLWFEETPKRQALWEAKMRLRAARDEDGRRLYAQRDWAGWVLTGDE